MKKIKSVLEIEIKEIKGFKLKISYVFIISFGMVIIFLANLKGIVTYIKTFVN